MRYRPPSFPLKNGIQNGEFLMNGVQRGSMRKGKRSGQFKKKTRDLHYLFEMFPDSFTEGDKMECRKLLALEDIPLDEEIPFDWPQTDLDYLYGSVQHQPLGGENSGHDRDEQQSDSDDMDVPDRSTCFDFC